LHFFLRFSSFLGLFPSQPVVSRQLASAHPLPRKSCQKHYRRFFVRSALCHNQGMNERTVQWETGRQSIASVTDGRDGSPSRPPVLAGAVASARRPYPFPARRHSPITREKPATNCNSARPDCG
jgi:hypothetical protein